MAEQHDQPMTQETALANAHLVLPNDIVHGCIYISDGIITEISEGDTIPPGAIDCAGDLVIPGLIELHTDNLERHIQPRPRVDWPHAAAIIAHDGELASCGITTVFDAMRVGSVVSNSKTNYGKYARQLATELNDLKGMGALRIDHKLHLRAEICSETLIAELGEFHDGDSVGLISLMDHTPGQRQFRDVNKLRDYICGKHGLSEVEFIEHIESQKALQARLGAAHEKAAVTTAQELGAVLASHDDTTEEQVTVSAAHGVRLAEFPTTTEAAQACHDHNIAVMMGAPNLIRGGSHSGNVAAEELARAGLLDIVSSDYVPSALLSSAFRLAAIWDDLPRAIRTVTERPAQATNLDDRGQIKPGLRADLAHVAQIGDHHVIRGTWVYGQRVA